MSNSMVVDRGHVLNDRGPYPPHITQPLEDCFIPPGVCLQMILEEGNIGEGAATFPIFSLDIRCKHLIGQIIGILIYHMHDHLPF